jgi:hypothetical protein
VHLSPSDTAPFTLSMDAQSWRTCPTVVEGLERRTARSNLDAGGLHATCIDCGSHAHDWRRLLGLGARFMAAPGDAGSMLVRCTAACAVCGSDALIVTAR